MKVAVVKTSQPSMLNPSNLPSSSLPPRISALNSRLGRGRAWNPSTSLFDSSLDNQNEARLPRKMRKNRHCLVGIRYLRKAAKPQVTDSLVAREGIFPDV